MDQVWQTYEAWVAYFDILGYKKKIENLPLPLLQLQVDETIHDLQRGAAEFPENIDCLFYADTFIFYSRSNEDRNCPGILSGSTHFIERCLSKGMPVRGAISFGKIAVGHEKKALVGKAYLECHNYAEDQNWIGLVLAPSATKKVQELGLDPTHHGFINRDVPLRKCSKSADRVYAYTFCRGEKNFTNPLLKKVEEMQDLSPASVKDKYENTLQFIRKYDRVIK